MPSTYHIQCSADEREHSYTMNPEKTAMQADAIADVRQRRKERRSCGTLRAGLEPVVALLISKRVERPNGSKVSDGARQARVATQSVNEKEDSQQNASGAPFDRPRG